MFLMPLTGAYIIPTDRVVITISGSTDFKFSDSTLLSLTSSFPTNLFLSL